MKTATLILNKTREEQESSLFFQDVDDRYIVDINDTLFEKCDERFFKARKNNMGLVYKDDSNIYYFKMNTTFRGFNK